MKESDVNRIQLMDMACRNCIRAIYLFDAATEKDGDMWAFIQNCLGHTAAIEWCHIFNKYEDDTHFTQLFGQSMCPITENDFSLEIVRKRIWASGKFTESTFNAFRKQMKAFRDEWAAHRDVNARSIVFPEIDFAKSTCLEMRSILQDYVSAVVNQHSSIEEQQLRNLLENNSNKYLISQYEWESHQLTIL